MSTTAERMLDRHAASTRFQINLQEYRALRAYVVRNSRPSEVADRLDELADRWPELAKQSRTKS